MTHGPSPDKLRKTKDVFYHVTEEKTQTSDGAHKGGKGIEDGDSGRGQTRDSTSNDTTRTSIDTPKQTAHIKQIRIRIIH